MDEAEQVSWGGSRPGDWDLPGWRRGSKPPVTSSSAQFAYGPRHKVYLLVPFICFKFNNIYYPGISSVDPSLQCILCVPGPVGDSRVRVRMQEM